MKYSRDRAVTGAVVVALASVASVSVSVNAEPAKNAGSALPMIKIPGADYDMGSKEDHNSVPVHKVTVAAFEMDKDLVTAEAYQACIDAKACTPTSGSRLRTKKADPLCTVGTAGKGKHPANCVTYNQAKAFCEWAGKRLPTEEEWELAARGTDGREYPWGNDEPEPKKKACWGRDQTEGTCEVGSFPDGNTPLGLRDMAGDVEEWTSSTWTSDYEKRDHSRDLVGGTAFVSRSGGWRRGAAGAMATYVRGMQIVSNEGTWELGMRCAR